MRAWPVPGVLPNEAILLSRFSLSLVPLQDENQVIRKHVHEKYMVKFGCEGYAIFLLLKN